MPLFPTNPSHSSARDEINTTNKAACTTTADGSEACEEMPFKSSEKSGSDEELNKCSNTVLKTGSIKQSSQPSADSGSLFSFTQDNNNTTNKACKDILSESSKKSGSDHNLNKSSETVLQELASELFAVRTELSILREDVKIERRRNWALERRVEALEGDVADLQLGCVIDGP
ncbi:hypothetical protein KCU78_g1267, partial [Aureobasidium melanogenum]